MNESERGQVVRSAAEVYEAFFLPALFQQWAEPMLDRARIAPGQRVLDIACGTGVLARAALQRVGPTGSVVGVDINAGMLDVAKRQAPQVTWREARAESLPFAESSFDAVVCQFGLMFFEDRQAAVREMARVLRSGGWLAVAVWDSLGNTPGYAAAVKLLQRLFGQEAANALRAPFALGDRPKLRRLFAGSGLDSVGVETVAGTASFPSIEAWMYTDIRGWTLSEKIDDTQFEQLLAEAHVELQSFVNGDGTVTFDAPAHLVTGKGTD